MTAQCAVPTLRRRKANEKARRLSRGGFADVMAERIVDALELVEIETQHRQALAALDALYLVVELLEQQHAVGQIGQRVMACHVRDALFRALTFSYIFLGCRRPRVC